MFICKQAICLKCVQKHDHSLSTQWALVWSVWSIFLDLLEYANYMQELTERLDPEHNGKTKELGIKNNDFNLSEIEYIEIHGFW